MQVIKKGNPQVGWTGEYKCTGNGNGGGGCGAILKVSQGDLFQTTSCHMGETDYMVTFECPCCEVLTDIKNSPFHACDLPHVTVHNCRRVRKSDIDWR